MILLAGGAVVGALLAWTLTDDDPGHSPTVFATALVAVFVAWLTAYTTDRRQSRQLAHESEARAQDLAAEERRLGMRFAHERIMEDLRELRAVLDEARASAMELIDGRYVELVVDSADGEGHDLALEWRARHLLAVRQQGRLELRLGHDHPVTASYNTAIHKIFECVKEIRAMALSGQTEGVDARSKAGTAAFERGINDFTERARGLIGSAHEIVEAGD